MNIYDISSIEDRLKGNSYVGRGIIVGKSENGKKLAVAYFIMGRSNFSRNRILNRRDGALYTEVFDTSLVVDPSLLIYTAIRKYKNNYIITNGDQTDTIFEFLKRGKRFVDALATREFEPDPPTFTPRISVIIRLADNDFTYDMSILKSEDPEGTVCQRNTFSFAPICGLGHFIHTYICDSEDPSSAIPSFCGEPERVRISNDIDEFTKSIWESLDADNKISLYTEYIDLESDETEFRLINKNKEADLIKNQEKPRKKTAKTTSRSKSRSRSASKAASKETE